MLVPSKKIGNKGYHSSFGRRRGVLEAFGGGPESEGNKLGVDTAAAVSRFLEDASARGGFFASFVLPMRKSNLETCGSFFSVLL